MRWVAALLGVWQRRIARMYVLPRSAPPSAGAFFTSGVDIGAKRLIDLSKSSHSEPRQFCLIMPTYGFSGLGEHTVGANRQDREALIPVMSIGVYCTGFMKGGN